MARRTIFSIGLDLPDVEGLECFSIRSNQSLFDADIIVFRPSLFPFKGHGMEEYQGRPVLSQSSSFEIKEKSDHWRTQFVDAFESGKTIVVFVPAKEEVLRYTGDESFSGTGRSRVTTRVVAPVSNYDFLPLKFDELVPGQGRTMKLASNADTISTYWQHASSMSVYKAHFKIPHARHLVLTRSGEKVVGAILSRKGNIVILPNIEWDVISFKTASGYGWTKAAKTFTLKLRDAILGIDAAVRKDAEGTPEPDWAKADTFRLAMEAEIEKQILGLSSKIETLVKEREKKRGALRKHASLRYLLFTKGKPLEAAVRDALRILGFDAERFQEADSEFDVLFSSKEGRFIGEVEGKDSKAVNMEKYSQLERNINEDLARDEITVPAKGVLFGNAHRLLPPSERGEFFTEKVLVAARRTSCALVRTPDLFTVARYLKDNANETFAEKCRKAIAGAEGAVVVFPNAPKAKQEKISESV